VSFTDEQGAIINSFTELLPASEGQLPYACYWVLTHTLGWFAVELELEDLMIQAEEPMAPLHSSRLNLTKQ